jgi:AGCS family alanine or glycine:cation symporter
MWVTAFLGGATAFVESTLAQVYKKKNPDGTSYGGPAFYMQQALHARWLGIVFSILIIFTYAVGYNMLAAYNLQTSFKAFDFYSKTSTPAVIGVILMVLFAVIVLGGAKRLVNVTGILVPVMGVLYVAISILVLVLNAGNLPAMFGRIFASAFDFKAIFGGFTGSCLMFGLKRGLYSNEAGMGSAPNAAATADVSHPAKQGLVQMLSVFIDTLLICSATALMCLSTNVMPADYATKEPIEFVQDSMSSTLGSFGPVFVTIALTLFAFTTLIGNYSYCEGCLKFILKKDPSPAFLTVFRLVASAIILLGAIASANLVWDTADMAQGLMVVTNVPSILILGSVALKCFKDYERQRKEGKNPVFKAANIGLFDKLDFWQ